MYNKPIDIAENKHNTEIPLLILCSNQLSIPLLFTIHVFLRYKMNEKQIGAYRHVNNTTRGKHIYLDLSAILLLRLVCVFNQTFYGMHGLMCFWRIISIVYVYGLSLLYVDTFYMYTHKTDA